MLNSVCFQTLVSRWLFLSFEKTGKRYFQKRRRYARHPNNAVFHGTPNYVFYVVRIHRHFSVVPVLPNLLSSYFSLILEHILTCLTLADKSRLGYKLVYPRFSPGINILSKFEIHIWLDEISRNFFLSWWWHGNKYAHGFDFSFKKWSYCVVRRWNIVYT